MKSKFLFIAAVMILLGTSCARVIDVFERPVSPDIQLYQAAEESFSTNEYGRALELYTQYLQTYPEGPRAPLALLKIGIIQTESGRFEAARATFADVIEKYPETDAAGWARVENLYSYLREGRPDDVLDHAAEIEIQRFPAVMRMRINQVAGGAYIQKEAYEEAFKLYLKAFEDAPGAHRESAGEHLMMAASHLDAPALQSEIDALNGRPPAGYLLYRKGLNMVEAGRIGEAIAALSDFTGGFPRHPLAPAARDELEQLRTLAYFEGHRIGVLLPLTGQYAAFGRQALRGIELALDQYSSRVRLDPPLEIIVFDTAADMEKTARGVRELGEMRVAAIVGPIVMAEAAAREAQAMEIPIITLTQQAGICDIGDYVFRNFLTPRMQVDVLANHATGTLGLKRFAILYPDEAYGETFLHLFWDRLIENEGIVVGVEKYNPEKTDFSDPIKKLVGLYYDVPEELEVTTVLPLHKQLFKVDVDHYEGELPALVRVLVESAADGEDPWGDKGVEEGRAIVDFDAIFIPDSPRVAGLIIPQLRYYDIDDAYLLGTNLWHSQQLIDIAGRQLRKVVIPEGFFGQSRKPGVGRFIADFEGIYDYAPGYIEAAGYDSAMMLFDVIVRPDIDNRVGVKNALLDMPPFDGVTGVTRFDETGEAVKDLYLLQVSRGRFLEIH